MRFVKKLPSGCWEWTGRVDKYGYGCFWDGTKKVTAHTWAFRHWKGEPSGQIDHTCHDRTCGKAGPDCPHRRCVNPACLEDVTGQTNTLRGSTLPALNALKATCPQGHPYDGVNANGARICRRCMADADRRYRARRRSRSSAPAAPSP